MKITIEPTEKSLPQKYHHDKICIENDCDHVTLDEVIDMIFRLLVAWGFSAFNIANYFNENCDIATLYFPEEDKNTASDIDE